MRSASFGQIAGGKSRVSQANVNKVSRAYTSLFLSIHLFSEAAPSKSLVVRSLLYRFLRQFVVFAAALTRETVD